VLQGPKVPGKKNFRSKGEIHGTGAYKGLRSSSTDSHTASIRITRGRGGGNLTIKEALLSSPQGAH